MHNQDLGRVAVVARGTYDPSAEYERLDAVSYNGSSYLVRKHCQGVEPAEGEYYMLMAKAGDSTAANAAAAEALAAAERANTAAGNAGQQAAAAGAAADAANSSAAAAREVVDTVMPDVQQLKGDISDFEDGVKNGHVIYDNIRIPLTFSTGYINNGNFLTNNWGIISSPFSVVEEGFYNISLGNIDLSSYPCKLVEFVNGEYKSETGFSDVTRKTILHAGREYYIALYTKTYGDISSQIQTLTNGFSVVSSFAVKSYYKGVYYSDELLADKAYAIHGLLGKNVLFYGDSITEIGMLNKIGYSWESIVSKYFNLGETYIRGVSGASVAKNALTTQTFYVLPDGESGGTESNGTECDAYFASWKRITSMIPSNIRENIDIIVVMGGTNDMGAGVAEGDFTFSASNTSDDEWISSDQYKYGDFDISTFKGALASTIFKLQVLCPNAVIVIASPLSGRGETDGVDMTEPVTIAGHTTEDFRNWAEDTAHYMSVPFIDVFGTTGINQFNRSWYIYDKVHPKTAGTYGESNEGSDAIARAMISGLKSIKLIN